MVHIPTKSGRVRDEGRKNGPRYTRGCSSTDFCLPWQVQTNCRAGQGKEEGSDEATDACLTDVVQHYKTGGSSSCRDSAENNIINRGQHTRSYRESSSAAARLLRKRVVQRMKLVQERPSSITIIIGNEEEEANFIATKSKN